MNDGGTSANGSYVFRFSLDDGNGAPVGNQPLEIKVNGLRALRIEDNGDSASDAGTTPDGTPNLIGGSPRRFVAAGGEATTVADAAGAR